MKTYHHPSTSPLVKRIQREERRADILHAIALLAGSLLLGLLIAAVLL
jgi:hypothetical protein